MRIGAVLVYSAVFCTTVAVPFINLLFIGVGVAGHKHPWTTGWLSPMDDHLLAKIYEKIILAGDRPDIPLVVLSVD
ncbi:hypothetical protein CsSME_00045117 [Camellia sinensis var. sinensis]